MGKIPWFSTQPQKPRFFNSHMKSLDVIHQMSAMCALGPRYSYSEDTTKGAPCLRAWQSKQHFKALLEGGCMLSLPQTK